MTIVTPAHDHRQMCVHDGCVNLVELTNARMDATSVARPIHTPGSRRQLPCLIHTRILMPMSIPKVTTVTTAQRAQPQLPTTQKGKASAPAPGASSPSKR